MDLNKDLLLVIDSSGLGDGEPDLGERLMKAFLNVLFESGDLPARIICDEQWYFPYDEGSPVLDILKGYEDEGNRNPFVRDLPRLLRQERQAPGGKTDEHERDGGCPSGIQEGSETLVIRNQHCPPAVNPLYFDAWRNPSLSVSLPRRT